MSSLRFAKYARVANYSLNYDRLFANQMVSRTLAFDNNLVISPLYNEVALPCNAFS